MLIGFGCKGADDEESDEAALREIGCERSYFWSQRGEIAGSFERVMEFLRPQDTLVVIDFDRLANDLPGLLAVLKTLHTRQIGLQVQRHALHAEIAAGEEFLRHGALLADAARLFEGRQLDNAAGAQPHRGRGRPRVLSSEDRQRMRQLLLEKGASVLDVARLLRVSPATIYRYSPRRRSDQRN